MQNEDNFPKTLLLHTSEIWEDIACMKQQQNIIIKQCAENKTKKSSVK